MSPLARDVAHVAVDHVLGLRLGQVMRGRDARHPRLVRRVLVLHPADRLVVLQQLLLQVVHSRPTQLGRREAVARTQRRRRPDAKSQPAAA